MPLVLPLWHQPGGQKWPIWLISGCLHRERVMGNAMAAGLLALPMPGALCKPEPRPRKSQVISLWRSPKAVGFSFPFLSPHFSSQSAVSSSSITQTPNTSEEAIQLNLSWLQLAPEWKVSSVREGEACARRSWSWSCCCSPLLPSPPLSNDTQWSITPQQSQRCPEASLWSGAIDQVFLFFKEKMIMITRGHHVSELAVPLGGRARCLPAPRRGLEGLRKNLFPPLSPLSPALKTAN